MEPSKLFKNYSNTFTKHGKSLLIKQLPNKKPTPTETLTLRLSERETFWTRKLKLTPRLNKELTSHHDMQHYYFFFSLSPF